MCGAGGVARLSVKELTPVNCWFKSNRIHLIVKERKDERAF
jgi:hypothetical protein